MIDLRKEKVLDLTKAECLKEETTYAFEDEVIRKKLIAKFIGLYPDEADEGLLVEFKKMALLSAEPEIATVYFLVTGDFGMGNKSCYIMDFIEGPTLGKALRENERISAAFMSDILGQLSTGLEKAHHYEIIHGDLHEENIMINNFGYVKIIDFLWWDNKLSFIKNAEVDILAFISLVKKLFEKLSDSEKKLFELQYKYLLTISSFRGVSKNIEILRQVSNDFSLIDDHSKKILAHIINSIIPEANLMFILENKSVKIPDHYIPGLKEKERKFMENIKRGETGINYQDLRTLSTYENLKQVFNIKLHQLKQAGFISWQLGVDNVGEKFVGPYVLNFRIFFTSKIFEWKRLNQEFNFLVNPQGKSLADLILE